MLAQWVGISGLREWNRVQGVKGQVTINTNIEMC
jgi:hypothetical protein